MIIIDQNSLKHADDELKYYTGDVLLTESLFAEMVKSEKFEQHYQAKMRIFLNRPNNSYLSYSPREIVLRENAQKAPIDSIVSDKGTLTLRIHLNILGTQDISRLKNSVDKLRDDLKETYFKEDRKPLYEKVISLLKGKMEGPVNEYRRTKHISDYALGNMAFVVNAYNMNHMMLNGWSYDQAKCYISGCGFLVRGLYLKYICGFMYLGDNGFENMKDWKIVNQDIDNNIIVKSSYGHSVLTKEIGLTGRRADLDRMIALGRDLIPNIDQLVSIRQ